MPLLSLSIYPGFLAACFGIKDMLFIEMTSTCKYIAENYLYPVHTPLDLRHHLRFEQGGGVADFVHFAIGNLVQNTALAEGAAT